ncbi:hypothetical protein SLW70_16270 [Flavobacterium sp. NG2]|uniref:hypothetical protein n=1 Tax=Flavobacterium sp. NG2 TaxID=3097547 RepID=UPI002A7EE96B|nr:hypothetical protein [Flavobacterium sp. NG2]WPR71470.1 hypothetical protein SLW70_16270 [Flavobacterium sp. NG2]
MKFKPFNCSFTLLLLLILGFSQLSYSQFFVETKAGLNASISPKIYNFSHIGFGVGYMHNSLVGVKIDYAKDDFSNANGFSNSKRADVQLMANLSNLIFDKSYYDSFFVLAHAGMGMSSLQPSSANVSDTNINFMMGITPKYKIIDGLDLIVDASLVMNTNQNYNFDGSPTYQDLAVPQVGYLFNLSVGLMYRFIEY